MRLGFAGKALHIIARAAILFTLSACAIEKLEQNPGQSTDEYMPKQNISRLFFANYSDNWLVGSKGFLGKLTLMIDGTEVGSISGDEYIDVDLFPGRYTLYVKGENLVGEKTGDFGPLTINASANSPTFVFTNAGSPGQARTIIVGDGQSDSAWSKGTSIGLLHNRKKGSVKIAGAFGEHYPQSSSPAQPRTETSLGAMPTSPTAPNTVAQAPPLISVNPTISTTDQTAEIVGSIYSTSRITTFQVNGSDAPLEADGRFSFRRAVKIGTSDIKLTATDEWGRAAESTIRVTRSLPATAAATFPPLDPSRIKAKPDPEAVALIIGIDHYKSAPPAEFAENDARQFYDYATNALGVPPDRIKLLIGSGAERVDIEKAVTTWVTPLVVKGQTDVYVYFSGHGLATPDGKDLYLLPYDGDRDVLADSAIRRAKLIHSLVASGARSTTLFLDTCYSGGTRTGGTLMASARPILIAAREPSVPSSVTILTAAANDQLSSVLDPVRHGLFSYWLMRGLQGEAAGAGRTLTAAQLESYLTEHVPPQAAMQGLKQTPELIGDGGKELSTW